MELEWMGLCILVAAVMWITGSCYVRQENKRALKALVLKGGTTLLAASLAIYQGVTMGEKVAIVVAIGAVMCAAADVVLQWHFIAGGAIFGGAHILLMISFLLRIRDFKYLGVIFIILLGIMIGVQWSNIAHFKNKLVLGIMYVILLSGMTSFGILIFLQTRTLIGFLVGLGGCCFYISDNILAKTLFDSKKKNHYEGCLLFFYYTAVYLLCVSV